MLQELLNLGLVEIGSEDSRFEKMQAAASTLVTRFGEDPRLLIPATLIALDEDVDAEEAFFTLVEGFVTEEWKTLRNTHTNRPRQLLRSITIDALTTKAFENAEISSVIWSTAADRLRHQQTQLGKAVTPIQRLFEQAFETAEVEAIKRSGMSEQPVKRKSNKQSSDPTELNLDSAIKDEELITDVERASGPTNASGQPIAGANPNWTNVGQPWSNAFNPHMTAALVKAVNLGTSRLGKVIAKDLANHIATLEEEAGRLQEEREHHAAASRMRLDVLWWSEARYSPLLKRGYRELTPTIGALAAAVDLTTIVPALTPASVAHVLGETITKINNGTEDHQSTQTLEYHLKSLAETPLALREALPRVLSNEGRVLLLNVVADTVSGSPFTKATVQARAGVKIDLQLTPADFAMWMFREIQAHRMVEELA